MTRTRSILAARNIIVLHRFTAVSCLLVFDYDGTLAPIALLPERAHMRARTRRLLGKAASLYPCAVISGRARTDIAARVAGTGVKYVFGNHGLEPPGRAARPQPQIRGWVTTLRTKLAGLRGVVIEDKRYSVSVHYRAALDWEEALASITPVVRALPDVRIIYGAAAVNLLPRNGSNKGEALQRALALSKCDVAIYLGDDETDEDAFAAAGPKQLLAIRIERSGASHATYHLESQEEIDRLLEALIQERSG